ncbi:hypothetical protein PHYBLDRAFT_169858 [Phycomyces blakesleeanus NRRL 1555(-)]|uniref:Uncharacterized protein n=1 Tax=Phycomyces blakesleeanus (strain ATCC 8743b / DSM 1359 / FGSC 10004 / NBRC 33097 / NRRL 1555) TaxID=763407 RepID=A0A167M6G6_PHYB8|nr:hypothetical protein PHYBLDRAFT_169858 [Phycomyces blakesleeanus NRRL 1555(-)]OAD71947.1 hypothetical protein PHYBLDRAFT_169858 [Phycomyces blakesleeanus NRRL 1555(-)]|eukprot:XP_018289987.1 hypothetical protein PHYBLDRAFT_169858 [Phycomyces blakesleeanus NRRL 1555(-)]
MYKQITRKMAPITPRTPRSNARNSLTQVAVGRVEQHLVVPAVTQEQRMTEMSARLDNMGTILGSLDNRFGQFINVQRRNTKTVGAIAMSLASTSRQVLPAVAPSAAPSFDQMSEEETKVAVLALIREKIWKKDFRSNDSTEIAGNEARQRWNIDERVDYLNNVVVVAYLQEYIHAQSQTVSFWPGMVVSMIKTHTLPEQRVDNNRRARIASQIKEIITKHIYTCRQDIYTRYWRVIDKEMGLTVKEDFKIAFFSAIQKGAMSDGKSDTEKLFPGFPVRVLKVARPSWRSNEFNKFLGLIDESMHSNHKAKGNAKPRMPRFLRGEKNVTVPCWLILSLPPWAIKQ